MALVQFNLAINHNQIVNFCRMAISFPFTFRMKSSFGLTTFPLFFPPWKINQFSIFHSCSCNNLWNGIVSLTFFKTVLRFCNYIKLFNVSEALFKACSLNVNYECKIIFIFKKHSYLA